MRLQAIIAMALLLLAGCTDDSPDAGDADDPTGPADAPDETGQDDGTDDADDKGGDEGNATENQPPEITLSASILNGTAPFNTTITVAGKDADDDPLHWTIDVGADGVDAEGDGVPGTHALTFDTAGAYEVLGTLSDGEHTVEAALEIVVVAAAPDSQSVDGETVGQSTACTEEADWSDGEGYAEVDIVAGTIGHGFYVEFTENSAYHRVVFTDAAGEVLESHMLGLGIGVEPGEVDDGDWEMYGTVPDAAATLVLISCGNIIDPVDGVNPFHYEAGPDVAA